MSERSPKKASSVFRLAVQESEDDASSPDVGIDSLLDAALPDTRSPLEVNDLARVTLDSIADAVISTDAAGRVVYMNSTGVDMTGWTLKQAYGRPLAEVLMVVDASTGQSVADPALCAIAQDSVVSLPLNCILVRRDGSEVEIEDSVAPIHDRQGRLVGAVIIFRDARFSQETVNKMLYLARHDPLTGQANRFALREEFELARRMAKRHDSKIGVLFIDIDRFKFINDTLGHDAGDDVLVKLSQCLQDCLREVDTLSRYGGDEFVVLLGEINGVADAAIVATKLKSAAIDAGLVSMQLANLSLSIGCSVYPDDGKELGELVQKADRAMFEDRTEIRQSE